MPEKTLWNVGDKVRTNLDHAWVYAGTERQGLMGKSRSGTVIEVPQDAANTGRGLLLVRWESLTSKPLDRAEWWTHSDLILRSAGGQ